ncbi:MAG: type II CAAX endopeptidase family protein [Candidatus Microsaccharimonas sp.]
MHKFIEKKMWLALVLPIWVCVSFILAQAIVTVVISLLTAVGVDLHAVNQAVLTTVAGGVIYIITLVLTIGLPWLIKQNKTTREELGLTRLPEWLDLLLAPAGFFVYVILSAVLALLAGMLPFVNPEQAQDTGFSQISQQYEFVLAFIMLIIIAPVAEEILFRGYLFGKLRHHVPVWVAILITSILFGVVHGAWNVGIDVFALSIVLCLLRVLTKSLWPSIILHMLKNAVAFYFLFINPTLLGTLGG